MHEDVEKMGTTAKYKGMRDQIERLRAKFARRLLVFLVVNNNAEDAYQ